MGEGFDFFYGFMGAEMNHWYPQLYKGRYAVEPDRLPEDGYHLSEDLVENAISWVENQQAITPDRPFFTYLALRSEEHTSELQSRQYLVCRLLLEKKKKKQ